MRITTNTMYNEGLSRLSTIQATQLRLSEQISTGKRFNSPSEDPIAAARALNISQSMDINNNYGEIRKTAQNNLSIIEGNLDSVTKLIISVQSSLVGAGNAALSNLERGFKANELQNAYDSLLGLANAQDASGKYLYAGFKTDTKPFTGTLTGATYAGGVSDEIKLKVDSSREMAVNVSGNDAFQNGTDLFAELKTMITALNTPITDAATQATFNSNLTNAIGKMKTALDNVLNVRSKVGSQLNELDELDVSGSALDLQYQSALSEIQDLDYAQALSEFTKTETMLEAAQKTFSATTKLSLFDYL